VSAIKEACGAENEDTIADRPAAPHRSKAANQPTRYSALERRATGSSYDQRVDRVFWIVNRSNRKKLKAASTLNRILRGANHFYTVSIRIVQQTDRLAKNLQGTDYVDRSHSRQR
jgi:hypothetical protein